MHRFIIAKINYFPRKEVVKISLINQELVYTLSLDKNIKDFVVDLFRRIGTPIYGYDRDFRNVVIYDSVESRKLIRDYMEIAGKVFHEVDVLEVNGNLI